jgi:hypothetical protein
MQILIENCKSLLLVNFREGFFFSSCSSSTLKILPGTCGIILQKTFYSSLQFLHDHHSISVLVQWLKTKLAAHVFKRFLMKKAHMG